MTKDEFRKTEQYAIYHKSLQDQRKQQLVQSLQAKGQRGCQGMKSMALRGLLLAIFIKEQAVA